MAESAAVHLRAARECYNCLAPPEYVTGLIRVRDIELCDVCLELMMATAVRFWTEDEYEHLKGFAP